MYTRKESYSTAWLKAERDLATSGYGLPPALLVPPSSNEDNLPMPTEKVLERIRQIPSPNPQN
jgi:hypothetical protein